MHDLFEQLRMHFWMVIHRRWVVLATAAVACALGWSLAKLIPDQYRVESKIYFNTQSVLKPLLEGIGMENQSREQTAALIQKTLLTRENLRAIRFEISQRGSGQA